MAVRVLPKAVVKIYRMPKPNIFSRGVPARLPEAYKKFYEEWHSPPTVPVHYTPEKGKWKKDPLTGEVSPVQNVPIPIKYPEECHTGLWGGEGVILGYKKQRKYVRRTTRWFVPTLRRTVVYSEILDKRLSVIVTKRTIGLIVDHKGLDNYLLETPDRNLKSMLAFKLKKKMLLALFDKTLYPDDPLKRDKIYDKYKHHMSQFNKDDLDWYALTITEAITKLMNQEDSVKPTPLKHKYRTELIEELESLALNDELEKVLAKNKKEASESWLSRMNPFPKNS